MVTEILVLLLFQMSNKFCHEILKFAIQMALLTLLHGLIDYFSPRLQVDYQVGVLISRSSVNIFPIDKLWLLTLLQVGISERSS